MKVVANEHTYDCFTLSFVYQFILKWAHKFQRNLLIPFILGNLAAGRKLTFDYICPRFKGTYLYSIKNASNDTINSYHLWFEKREIIKGIPESVRIMKCTF